MGRESAQVLKKIMITCSSMFTRFDFSDNCLGDEGAMLVAQTLKGSLHIVALNLASNNITASGASSIFEALVKNQSLVDLNLSNLPGTGKCRNIITGKAC